ncbi:MAG: serine hydrolase [Myxococcota bacterium]
MTRFHRCSCAARVALLFTLACGSSDAMDLPDAGAPDGGVMDAGAPDAGVPVPEGPAGLQLRWLLDVFAGEATLSTDEVSMRFTEAFLGAVGSAEEIVSILAQIRDESGPATLVEVEAAPDGTQLLAVVVYRMGTYGRVALATEAAAPNRIGGLLFADGSDRDPTLDTPEEASVRLAELAPDTGFLIAELVDGSCAPAAEARADAVLAIGSTFKLYVLAALADDVQAGTRAFTDVLAIRDDLKSLPSGRLQDEPEGTEVTLREHADLMISISDNTATDHLMFALGRENVERVMVESGHRTPARNTPFLNTRELFVIKLNLDAAAQDAYLAADVPARRELLQGYRALEPNTDVVWVSPRRVEDFEWFADAHDVCAIVAELAADAEVPATAAVEDVLAINPGIPDAAGLFSYVGFKGGSEPGVLNLTWLVRRASDGRAFVVSVGANDPDAPLDDPALFYVASAIRAQAARL